MVFTYSSGFGALALQMKQTREDFCSNWASLDWGKREWPAIGLVGEGGVRGVALHQQHISNVCFLPCPLCSSPTEPYCTVSLKSSRFGTAGPCIKSVCNC